MASDSTDASIIIMVTASVPCPGRIMRVGAIVIHSVIEGIISPRQSEAEGCIRSSPDAPGAISESKRVTRRVAPEGVTIEQVPAV